jgi:hypothetical protein
MCGEECNARYGFWCLAFDLIDILKHVYDLHLGVGPFVVLVRVRLEKE